MTETLAIQFIEPGSGIDPTNRENAAIAPTPVINALNLCTSNPPFNTSLECRKHEPETIIINMEPKSSELRSSVILLEAIIRRIGHATVAEAPTLVLELGVDSPISWTNSPHTRMIIGRPRPFSKPPSPLMAEDSVGQTNHIAPSSMLMAVIAINLSKWSFLCLMAAWIAPSTSDQASMLCDKRHQTYTMPFDTSLIC